MLHKALTFLLLLSISLTSHAQPKTKQDTGLLWRISGNGLEQPSYLFGTHHLIPLSFLDSINGLEEAFLATEQTIGELDMSNKNAIQMQVMTASLMPEDKSYDTLLSEEDRIILDEALKEYIGAGLSQFEKMKPAMLNTLLSVVMFKRFYPSDKEEVSMDEYFQQEARNKKRQTLGLESVEDQIEALFETEPIEGQAESLMCAIKNIDYNKEMMDKMMEAYYAKDLTSMAQLFEEDDPNNPCPSSQEEKDALNKKRNEKWMKLLPDMIKQKPSFIAVGCLHLVGKDGLISLLRDKGYTVTAVE